MPRKLVLDCTNYPQVHLSVDGQDLPPMIGIDLKIRPHEFPVLTVSFELQHLTVRGNVDAVAEFFGLDKRALARAAEGDLKAHQELRTLERIDLPPKAGR